MALTQAQRAVRCNAIMASEIGILAGVSMYKTRPIDVYLEKIGLGQSFESSVAMEAGQWLEGPIRERCARQMECELRIPDQFWPGSVEGTIFHPEYAWIGATPDGVLLAGGDPVSLVECKNIGSHGAHHWGESRDASGVPGQYLCQVMWQMLVTGIDYACVAVLIGGQDYRIYEVPYDPELGEMLVEVARRFWFDHVIPLVPPIEGPTDARRYIEAKYPKATRKITPAPLAAGQWARRWIRAERAEKKIAAIKERAEQELMGLIRDADGIEGPWGKAVWSNQRGKIAWKEAALAWREAAIAAGASADDEERFRGQSFRKFDVRMTAE